MTAEGVAGPPGLNRISRHVCWLAPDETTDRPIMGAVSSEHSTLIIEAGNSPAHVVLFLDGLAQVGAAPPRFVAVTHWHWDHVFGMQALDLPAVSSTATRRIIAEMARLHWSDEALDRRVLEGTEIAFCRDMIKAEWPERTALRVRPPDITFDSEMALDLGGVTCRIAHVGGEHAADASVVYVPEDGVLFLGDCLGEDLYSSPPVYTTARLFPLLERLLGFGAEVYLGAHDTEPTPRAQMAAYAARLVAIGREVERIGRRRQALLEALEAVLGVPPDEDDLAAAEAFLAGLG